MQAEALINQVTSSWSIFIHQLGGVIYSIGDYQDIRFMGGLSIFIPFTSSSLIVSNFPVCGIPFFTGYSPNKYAN